MEENILGKNIQYMRKLNGETLDELGFALNMTRSAIKDYESGRRKPNPDILKKICKRYGKTVDEMLNVKLYELERFDSTKIVDIDEIFNAVSIVLPIAVSKEAYENDSFFKGMTVVKEMLAMTSIGVIEGIKYFAEASEAGIYEATANILWCLFFWWNLSCTGMSGQQKFNSRLISNQVDWKEMMYETRKNKKKSVNEQLEFIENYDELINELIKELKGTVQSAPLGDYYLALRYVFGMVDTGLSDEMNQAVGMQMMISFARLDNRYALDFLKAGVEMK